MRAPAEAQPLLLSVDFEDWHQLVRRRVGVTDWDRAGPALERQTEVLLALFDELGVRATFFILGLAARTYPVLVRRIAVEGHEIACHGDNHTPVHTQTRAEFVTDLRAARTTIADVTGHVPVGYRAPAFSITQGCPWAYEVLAQEGFAYDSSQHDSPRLRGRIRAATGRPHRMHVAGGTLWEFPIAVWQAGLGPVPVGGASYWALMPTGLILRALQRAEPMAGLYLHPQEVDPRPLRAGLPANAPPGQRLRAAYRSAQRNLARRRTADVLRAVSRTHSLITYREAHARLTDGTPARS
ncbi:MAG TPA: polysaccharide deacetylase family protein [Solirubrobacteraceae bacterium]|jgi:polysaccharide deacetylase family protein (PEP-CTERM system associated)